MKHCGSLLWLEEFLTGLKMVAVRPSETSVSTYKSTRHYYAEQQLRWNNTRSSKQHT
jgi:hypothetical protein